MSTVSIKKSKMFRVDLVYLIVISLLIGGIYVFSYTANSAKPLRQNSKHFQDDSIKTTSSLQQEEMQRYQAGYSNNLKQWTDDNEKRKKTAYEKVYQRKQSTIASAAHAKQSNTLAFYEDLRKLEKSGEIDAFVNEAELLKAKYAGSIIKHRIAEVSYAKGFIEYAYDNIRDAVYDDPSNNELKELYKEIYEKRSREIIAARKTNLANR